MRYLQENGFTDLRAVDIKPFDEWYQVLPGVDNRVADLRSLETCHDAVRGVAHVYNLACDMGGMGFIEANKAACMISVLINTHLLMAGQGGRRPAALLLVVGVHLQRRPPALLRRDRAARGGRLPGAARGRLRLGEALLGAHVPELLRRLRHRDTRGALPQRLRPARHVRRRPREGAGRDLPEGRRGQARRRRRDRDLGRRRADAELHVHRRLPLRHDADHGERHPRSDQPRLVRAGHDQPAGRHRRGDRRRAAEAALQPRRAEGRPRAQLGQHADPGTPRLGAEHPARGRAGEDVRLDLRRDGGARLATLAEPSHRR